VLGQSVITARVRRFVKSSVLAAFTVITPSVDAVALMYLVLLLPMSDRPRSPEQLRGTLE
jgi:hypothetical protein